MADPIQECEVAVIGGGPGGYAAAFRAADLGKEVTLIDTAPRPGGVCLYRGCIPSKALLFLSQLIHDADRVGAMGVTFGAPQIDLDRLRAWKDSVVDQLTQGLVTLSKRRGVELIQARAAFASSDRLQLEGTEIGTLRFRQAILASGSHPIPLPGVPFAEGSRVMDSTGALALPEIPETLLVVGGGYIGLELGTVYAMLGSQVTVVELTDGLLPGTDRDLVRPLARRLGDLFEAIHLETKVAGLQETDEGVEVTLQGKVEAQRHFDRVLVSIGRRPNSRDIGLENTQVQLDGRGFVLVDEQRRTTDERIYAIGDVVGGMMLAHKAMAEGKVAAEAIAGRPAAFDVRAIPAVVYTEPQIAYCGLTETAAKEQGTPFKSARFPWGASGRALTMDATDGFTKMLFEPETERVLGVGIVGREAGEMIAEGVLAVEMGALAEDLARSIHPHPTLSETMGEVAEAFQGLATHIFVRRR